MSTRPIINPSFEDGTATGWSIPAGVGYQVTTAERTPYGQYTLRFTTGTPGLINVMSVESYPVFPGKKITASCNYSQGPASSNKNTGRVVLEWHDSDDNKISESLGTLIFATGSSGWNQGPGMVLSSVTATAPDNTASVKIGVQVNKNNNDWCSVDNFVWDYEALPSATITSPTSAGIYKEGTIVPLRTSYTIPTGMEVTSAKYVVSNVITSDTLEFTSDLTTSPWAVNADTIPAGSWKVQAFLTLNSGEIVSSDEVVFTVGDPPPKITREYRASNSAAMLVLENFSGLSSALPSTALVTGVELLVTSDIDLLSRIIDKDVDVEASVPDTVFSVITGGIISAKILNKNNEEYSSDASAMTSSIPINRADFTLDEEGTSEEFKWVTFKNNTEYSSTLGSKDELFGINTLSVQDFLSKSIGIQFFPELGSIPPTSERGNACIRFKVDSVRLRVYFDAGSVEYYFSSPDGNNVLKGILVSSNVSSGDLRNGDATGTMQLSPELEVLDGMSKTILKDYEVHSHYPPTDENKIADVMEDMNYNGLPSYPKVTKNRSRYQFITANFYGDERLNSIYGVNGVDRAFSYNGKDFYKIHTQPEADKDLPRHIAEHHLHLALGYQEGRVDMSVVGEPYNFSGVDGASSWGVGDGVTGLLKLSGTILGVFGSNSISGLSGTTVDNFAVQTISPKMGALEYTVVDMGYPVYANSYGIYTLSQTQQYGDYLGSPLSQDISPWLRPRLIRKDISDKEVVISWPVRSKNQYRLAFADGYILTMTMNNGQQSAPTFSLQKYFSAEGAGNFIPVADVVEVEFEDISQGGPGSNSSSIWSKPEEVMSQGDQGTGELPYGGAWRLTFSQPVRLSVEVDGPAYSGLWWEGGSYISDDGSSSYGYGNLDGHTVITEPTTYLEYSSKRVGTIPQSYEIENYRFTVRAEAPSDVSYDAPAIVPAAVSSQLDQGGEERIHIADYETVTYSISPPSRWDYEWDGHSNDDLNTFPVAYSKTLNRALTVTSLGVRYTDDAETWTVVAGPNNYHVGGPVWAESFDRFLLFKSTSGNANPVQMSQTGEAGTWEPFNFPTSDYAYMAAPCYAHDLGAVYVFGGNELNRQVNIITGPASGTINNVPGPTGAPSDVRYAWRIGGYFYVSRSDSDNPAARLWRSPDGFNGWEEVGPTSDDSPLYTSMAAASDGRIVLTGTSSGAVYTSPDGSPGSFTRIPPFTGFTFTPSGVGYVPDLSLFVVLSNEEHRFLTSTDGAIFSVHTGFPDGNYAPPTWCGNGMNRLIACRGGSVSYNGFVASSEIKIEEPKLTSNTTSPTLVQEFEKGWSFDGNYIPHFVELNWYFGDNPVDFRELSNVRVHGLTKGNVKLSVSTNGMETDSDFYAEDYSEPQIIDLPRKLDKHVTSEYVPVTNYEQPLNRGIAVQMKFEGRNEDLSKPEPSHVIQVLVTQSSPVGNGNRSY